ncbi:hypothetical protein DSCA_22270 [Desulfosarcina alkanivorans]|jgi:hypothetical protein|uniref:Uncharacterized protein n=1 Tax=Desulfosarcina alkanivorans TaxID=571177 RepID=A0A5K7YUD4_9BACT|nr:hypothetical protein [Desulfosarcina alkanivorans]BBO68297.1 hypothetical protein DSCA_22270 [Desulfosarcina alkanivorans]
MAPNQPIEPVLNAALATVSDFIRQVTGREATQAELADALTRYFVLIEIKDHIVMMREDAEPR